MQMLLHLSVGEVINQREILSRLSQMQYTRNDVSLTRGYFRVKGEVNQACSFGLLDYICQGKSLT
jgi:excinuclease ABC subunit B